MISRYQSASSQKILKRRIAKRVERTSLDYLVTAISPLLVMLLVGSLVFFAIQIIYRGEMEGGIRWVMFWFVIAIVLVARIGIEQSPVHAASYGAALAAATWLFLIRTHPAFLLGIALLSLVWWSSHKLVRDCTLIDDEDDSTDRGLTEGQPDESDPVAKETKKRRTTAKSAPGRWVIYYSIAALPVFGLGQLIQGDGEQSAFSLLFIYLMAAAGLLLSTSFLGLRRYLRQRSIKMPTGIATKWLTSGGTLVGFTFLIALLVPRPGVGSAWTGLNGFVEHSIQRASHVAMRFNASGTGEGREGSQAKPSASSSNDPRTNSPTEQPASSSPSGQKVAQASSDQSGTEADSSQADGSKQTAAQSPFIKWLVRGVLAFILIVTLICYGKQIIAVLITAYSALVKLLQTSFTRAPQPVQQHSPPHSQTTTRSKPFRAYTNPFETKNARSWSREALITYSYEALEAWAESKGLRASAHHTPIERVHQISRRFPEISEQVHCLAQHYSRLAYSQRLPASTDSHSLQVLWRTMSSS